MTKKEVVVIILIAIFGAVGITVTVDFIAEAFFPALKRVTFFCTVLFLALPVWLYEDIKKQYTIRDEERAAILKHEKHKQSIILKNHPLLESPDDRFGIWSMDQLDRYFDSYSEDVAGMDYDDAGHYIFRDHKYYFR